MRLHRILPVVPAPSSSSRLCPTRNLGAPSRLSFTHRLVRRLTNLSARPARPSARSANPVVSHCAESGSSKFHHQATCPRQCSAATCGHKDLAATSARTIIARRRQLSKGRPAARPSYDPSPEAWLTFSHRASCAKDDPLPECGSSRLSSQLLLASTRSIPCFKQVRVVDSTAPLLVCVLLDHSRHPGRILADASTVALILDQIFLTDDTNPAPSIFRASSARDW